MISDDHKRIPSEVPKLRGFVSKQNIHRKLLPRRPTRDASIEQHATLYYASTGHWQRKADTPASVLVLTPVLEPNSELPFYHPRVSYLALRYVPSPIKDLYGSLQIEVIPLPDTPIDIDSRLYRTCLALLETMHRYGWGIMTNYKKRVMHDCIVQREIYQDFYLVMRERHKHLVDTWQETTDPLKHVFEVSSCLCIHLLIC